MGQGFKAAALRASALALVVALAPTAGAKKKYGTKDWWPEEVRRTNLDVKDAHSHQNDWPPLYAYRPSGRVTVVKAPWEPPLPSAQEPLEMQKKRVIELWTNSPSDTAANIAHGNVMNTFQCLNPASEESTIVLAAIKGALPPDVALAVGGEASEAAVLSVAVNKLTLQYTKDNGVSQLEVEMMGQRTRQHPRGEFWAWPAIMGASYYATLTATVPMATAASLGVASPAEVEAEAEAGPGVPVQFWVSTTFDRDKEFNTMEYRFTRLQDVASREPDAPLAAPGGEGGGGGGGLTVMTYNVWNTNPPNWLYRSPEERAVRYHERMDLLCDVINKAGPPIIAFQEVRYDQNLGGKGTHFQMAHIMAKLPGYQHVYIPAMNYFNPQELARVEEGPAVASKYPIVSSSYLLLSRNITDTRDEHQRACVHAAVQVPGWGLVDVFTVHLSLVEEARDRTVVELWDFVTDTTIAKGVTQLLVGDMNAEPQERAMRFLSGEVAIDGVTTDFVDTWLALHPEPTPRSNSTMEQRDMLTFPSDHPSKRIDFIFARGKGASKVSKAWLVGQDPLPDVGRLRGDPPAAPEPAEGAEAEANAEAKVEGEWLGMVHADSKLWASDHRAYVATLEA